MRAWLYGRISNDEDTECNSQLNQQGICRSFAQSHGYKIVGQSFDEHISGMTFPRPGLDALTCAVEKGLVDCVIVKDLSRLGRHRTQTALFIDYLRQQNVRVLSATEGTDSFREEDELMMGVRSLMNDLYARDIGNKIRAGYRQKQKEGLVITPLFGYRKDRNTNEILLHPSAAETVRMIYTMYLQGCGQKEIARRLTALGRKTPAQIRIEQGGNFAVRKSSDGKFQWNYASVKNILTDESYTGLLQNHRTNTRNGKASAVPEAEWLRHEDFYPVIVDRPQWEQVQRLLKQNARPANSTKPRHRYAGLLQCRDCGSVFVPMNRCWNGKRRVEYVCNGYHRGGKAQCSSHRIHEEVLDSAVETFIADHLESLRQQSDRLAQMQKIWALRKPSLDAHILMLQKQVGVLEEEIDGIVMAKVKNT